MKIPWATYRLRFNPSFGFKEAKIIIESLSEIGISDIYASPNLLSSVHPLFL